MIESGDIIVFVKNMIAYRLFVLSSPTRDIDSVVLVPVSEYPRESYVEVNVRLESRQLGEAHVERVAFGFDEADDNYTAGQVEDWLNDKETFSNTYLDKRRVSESSLQDVLKAARDSGMPDDLKWNLG